MVLEDLLSSGSDAYLQLRILCADGLTGAPAVFLSTRFRSDDIRTGRFKRGGLTLAGGKRESR